MKATITVQLFLFFVLGMSARNFFVSPIGDDLKGNGSLAGPYATLMKAQEVVSPGDTVYLRGGTYRMQESLISKTERINACMFYLDKSGNSEHSRIHYFAFPGEQPVIDMSDVKPYRMRNIAFFLEGSWLHLKGIEVIGTQVTISGHTQSECFHVEGDYNIVEQCKMHDGMAIGVYLLSGSNNLIINCDAYRNWDSFSENGRGGNTDGFGGHPRPGSVGNVFRGCRAWFNSDDGFDCINAFESITFDHCWAFYNGYDPDFKRRADGNGFKAGGYGLKPKLYLMPDSLPSHIVQYCLAFGNKANGVYANHHLMTGNVFQNNTSVNNGMNFNMLSQKRIKNRPAGRDTTVDCAGFNHVLCNNIAWSQHAGRDTLNLGTCKMLNNSFSKTGPNLVKEQDFISMDASELILPRKKDGTLPEIQFLKPGKDCNLRNQGAL